MTNTVAIASELNLAYLMLKYGRGIDRETVPVKKQAVSSTATQKTATQKDTATQKTAPPAPPAPKAAPEESTPQSRIASYIRRSQQYMSRQDFAQAITELRDALKIDPNNSTCHALLGKAYLQKQQLTMAKVHINKACKVNPKDPIAVESKKELEKLLKKQNKSQAKSRNSGIKSQSTSGNSGLFSGLFGSKKK